MDDIVQPLGRVIPIPKGDFVLGTEYKKFDVVRDTVKNAVYVAKKDNKDAALTDEINWMLLVKGVGDGSGGSDNNYTDADKAKVTALPEANPGTAGGLALLSNVSNPNSFINPDYKIWQRGTSITKDTSTAGHYIYGADRHCLSNYSSTGNYATLTASQIDANTGGMHVETDGKCFSLLQILEHNIPNAVVTLSLKIKASAAHTAYCYADGETEKHAYPVSTDYTIITRTLMLPVTAGTEKIYYCVTSDSPYGAPYTLDIAWVKLEIGSVATPFVPRPYAEELALCQRYYEITDFVGAGVDVNGHNAFGNVFYKAIKRAIPTIKITSFAGTNGKIGTLDGSRECPVAVYSNQYRVNLDNSTDTIFNAGGNIGCSIAADAEIY